MIRKFILPLLPVVMLSSCSDVPVSYDKPVSASKKRKQDFGKFFGEDTFNFSDKARQAGETGGIGVNSFLWHAVLDTFSFMPLKTVDPFGGVIITEWHILDGNDNERFKVDVVILSRQLRSDGLRISVFKQSKAQGQWQPAKADEKMAKDLEDVVLIRARQLRIDSQG